MFLSAESTKESPRVAIEKEKRTLLIVDDEPQVQRLLARFLKSCDFDNIYVASTPEEAEQILNVYRITHLISDYELGNEHPRGTDLIDSWRRRYRSIEYAVLFTGRSMLGIDIPPSVDRYFFKGVDLRELQKVLKP